MPSRDATHPLPTLPDWLVQNRNFVLLWAGYGVAAVGDHLSEMALLQQRGGLERPDATRVQALISFGFFLPFVLIGPFAGWWSDRFSRRTTMVAADLLRAVIVFNLAAIVAALAPRLEPAGLGDFSIVIPLAAIGCLAAFFSPARQAMLPTLIRDDQLVRANALINALGTIGAILSAVVGGWLAQHAGPIWNYRANALTFVLSAIFVSLIAMRRTRAVPHPALLGIWTPVRQGFHYVATHRRILQMILLLTVFWAAAGIVISCVPAIVREIFGGQLTEAGMYRGIIGIGLAAGATVMTVVGPAMPVQIAVSLALGGAAAWLLALDLTYVFKLGRVASGLCLFGIGGAGAALLVTAMATIQRFVPDSRRGRVFGVSDTCTMAAMVLATGAIGLPNIPALDRYVPALLLIAALGMFAALLAAQRVYRRTCEHGPLLTLVWRFATFYARFMFRVRRVGPCTIPRRGPVILAANHSSGIDPILIYATSPHRRVAFLVERSYYRVPIAGWFQRLIGCIPIDRERPRKSTLRGMLRELDAHGCLGVFPQGRFEAPGETVDAKAGIGFAALRSAATVIPVYISGVKYSDSVARTFFTRHRAVVRYGKPVDLSRFAHRAHDRAAYAEAADAIMSAVRALAP